MPGATYSFKTEKAIDMLGKVEMLVIEQPGITRLAIAERLKMESSTVGIYLKRLADLGKVFLKRGQSGNTNIVTWWPGINPKPHKKKNAVKRRDRQQRQTIVTSWPANEVRDNFALPVDFFRSSQR